MYRIIPGFLNAASAFFVFMFVFMAFFAALPAEDLVSFDGGSINEADIAREGAISLYEAQAQVEELRRQILVKILKQRLVLLEEKNTQKKWHELIVLFIDKNYNADSAGVLKKLYSDADVKPYDPTGDYNEPATEDDQLKLQVENAYIVSLIQKYKVEFNLPQPQTPVLSIDIENQPFWGKPDAKITIVEFSDFECPYCKKMQTDILKIRKEYGDKIKWVFIDFPLEFHKNATLAHIGAHCAAEHTVAGQNGYFELQQLLFQSSPVLDKKTILELARSLKINLKDFQTCLDDKDGKRKKQVEANAGYAKKLGISGTPTVFINGKYHPGFLDYETLKEIIDKEL